MPLSKDSTDVVLRLLDGRSERREIVLVGGRAQAPFAVGGQAAWCVSAGHVASSHVMMAFNGDRLFICAAPGEMALLDGRPLDTRWTEAAMPSELRFGGARVSIGRRAGPDDTTQVPDDEATQIADALQLAAAARARPAVHALREADTTCFDEGRLQAALRLCVPDDAVTRIAEVEVPAAAIGPTNDATTTPPAPPAPAPRLPTHTVRLVRRESPPRLPSSARTLAAPETAEPQAQKPPTPLPQPRARRHAPRPPTPEPQSASGIMASGLLAGLGSSAAMRSAAIMDRDQHLPGLVAESASNVRSSCVPSSMPPTIPSDGLISAAMPAHVSPFPVAVARPSSPTIAIPELVARAGSSADHGTPPPLALDSIHAAALSTSGGLPAMTANAGPRAVLQQKLGELGVSWKQASMPKKAIALLMLPALIGALFTMRSATPASNVSVEQTNRTTPAPVVAPHYASESPTLPSASAARAETKPAVDSPSAKASSDAAPGVQPRPNAATARDTRTAERRALDSAATGHDSAAADQYAALAASRPDVLAFSEAARILRARADARHD